MRILFIHQNFPGQFKFLAPALALRGHEVMAMTMQEIPSGNLHGVKIVRYANQRGTTPNVHPWVADFETKIIRAEVCFRAALQIKQQGFTPDVIIAHHGWGESLFLKDVWSSAKLGIYCEYFYQTSGADVGFDSEFPVNDPADVCRVRLKNINNVLHLGVADGGISPTRWQAETFPANFRKNIRVVHDGIDTNVMRPNDKARLQLGKGNEATVDDEIITFVNRDLEPYRGYHIFMRSLPSLLKKRSKAQVLIVGGDGVSYGAAPPSGTWRDIFADEVKSKISQDDWDRVHFLGRISYDKFTALLQVSSVHVYLSYPFVLSWSLLEAMSIGCTIVASDTPPVREAIQDGETGVLVDFFDSEQLASEIDRLLSDSSERLRLGGHAREWALRNYDLKQVCLPEQIRWVEQLAG